MSVKILSNKANKENFLNILKGTIYAITFSLILILIFAMLIKFLHIPNSLILPINQAIKIFSLLFACFISIKNKGFISGVLLGILYSILSYLIFSFLCGNFSFDFTTFSDLLFSALIGGICGILSANIKRKK